MRDLRPGARETLRAPRLPEALQAVEDSVLPRCEAKAPELCKLVVLCRRVLDWRKRKGWDYPLPCLLAIMVMASLCGIVRGQRDFAAFASKLTQRQIKALGCYCRRDGRYDYPKETTFQRVLARLDAAAFEAVLLECAGGHGEGDDQVAIDGKAQRGSTPHVADEQKAVLVSAQRRPSGRVPGTVAVEAKSNEIPAARELLGRLDGLGGKLVMLDALHTCQETLRQIHLENGADYLMPVKGNCGGLEARAPDRLPRSPAADLPPLGQARARRGTGDEPAAAAAASEDRDNRSRHERRSLRWVAADAETLCCAFARSVIEVTRETTVLRGRHKGAAGAWSRSSRSAARSSTRRERPSCSGAFASTGTSEGGLHQRLEVSGAEDASRVRNRNAILVPGILRRSAVSLYDDWSRSRKNLRQSTFKDYHDKMNKFNNRLATVNSNRA